MLKEREHNDPKVELRVAAAEQGKISEIRLNKLLVREQFFLNKFACFNNSIDYSNPKHPKNPKNPKNPAYPNNPTKSANPPYWLL
jgi:hypothetical protein